MILTKEMENEFLTQYLKTLVWLNDDKKLTREQKKIQTSHALSFLYRCWYYVEYEPEQTFNQLGHDFALTHTRQGAGFWDGDWPVYGEMLTKLSHYYPEEF
jgi:hypothetical protein